MDNSKVTRFEVITNDGRLLARQGVRIQLSYQDDGRMLQIFIARQGIGGVMRTFGKKDPERAAYVPGLWSEGYPSCCGAHIIHGFHCPVDKDSLAKLSRTIRQDSLRYWCCILTADQLRRWKQYIEAEGFVQHYTFKNPGTGHTLTAFHRPRNPPRTRKKATKVANDPTAIAGSTGGAT